MKRLSRLTALLLAMALLLTSFGFAEGVKVEDLDAAIWKLWTGDDSSESAGETSADPVITTGGEVIDQGTTTQDTTEAPLYDSELKVEVAMNAAGSEGEQSVSLSQYGKADLTVSASGCQWQVNIAGQWIDVAGETGATFSATYAKLQSVFMLNNTGAAQVRCVAADGTVSDVVTVYLGYAPMTVPELDDDLAVATSYSATGDDSGIALAEETPELKEYTVVINYVFENNEIVADPYTATLAAGSSFSATVTHPTVMGYLPYVDNATETSTSIELNITNIQADVTYTVTYKPTNVDYTVIHYQQNLDNDNYTIALTETKQGLTKSTVPEVAKSYEGFYALLYEKPEIAADGSTVVEIYYDRYYYLMKFELDGGYGVEPIYARYGTTVSVGTPVKAGYTFKGWSPAVPATVPVDGGTYTAQWEMGNTANVTLVFWGENADDTGYSPLPSMTVTATPGTEFTYDEDGSLICGKEAHVHSESCGYKCGYTEHTHSLADNCYSIICSQSTHNHVNDGCTLACKHEHKLECYSTAAGELVETDKPNETLTDHGNGIYTYKSWFLYPTHYYLNIGDKWYCSNGDWGDVHSISLNCSHSHDDDCYTCGQTNSTHTHTIDGGCYTLTCQTTEHSHKIDCYACGKTEHSHDADCYIAGAGLDSNLWTFEKSDTVTVAADGSSVVNVYYKRTTKTLTFNYKYSNSRYQTTKTITAKWGEDISDEYVAIANDCGSTFWSATYNANGPYTNYFGIMPQTSATYYHRTANGENGSMMYYGQDLSGDYTVKLFQVDNVGGYSVTVEDRYAFEGFTYHHGTDTGSSCSGATFYYTRNTYDIEFYNPTELIQTVDNVYYEAPLGDYDFTPTADQAPASYEPGSVEFEGWYLNPECTGEKYILAEHTMPVGATNGEVALTLYAKWVPVNRTVSFYLDKEAYEAGTKLSTHPDLTVPHGSKVNEVPADPVKGSYTFVGWFYMDGETEKAFDFANMPINKDMKVYGKWSSNVLKEYTIYYKYITETDENGEPIEGTEIAEPTPGSGLAGITKTFEAKGGTELYADYQEGYFPLVKSHSMTLDINTPTTVTEGWTEITNDDGTTKIVQSFTFWYVQKEAVPYTVYYVAETLKDGEDATKYQTITRDGKTYYIIAETYTNSQNRKAVVTEKFKQVSGYMPDAYQKRLVVDGTDGAVNEIIFYYSVDSTHAYYKITHYTQNTDGASWTEYASSEAVGTIGETYTASPLSIDGFTHDPSVAGTLTFGVLSADGLELKLYYVRNNYPYQVRYLEQGTGAELADPKNGTGKYGAVVSESAIEITNYTAVDPTSQTLTIKIEEDATAKLNIITFYYVEKEVPINYVVVGPDGSGTVTPTSENVKVITGYAKGSTAEASSDVYKFDGWYSDAECTQLVSSELTYVPAQPGRTTAENGTVTNGIWPETTTYYAKFSYNWADLTITKYGLNEAVYTEGDSESAIFTVVEVETGKTWTVVLNSGNGFSVTLKNLTVGKKYTITEQTDWTWRYTAEDSVIEHTLLAPSGDNTVEFTNSRTNPYWLGGDNFKVNVFGTGN